MLEEYRRVTQEPGATGRRRWFQDDERELVVWLDAAGHCEGFQLCYVGARRQEYALTWRRQGGFSHSRVDGGDTRPDKNLTPVLTPDGAVPWERLRREFAACSAGLEPALRDFIAARLAAGGR
jgi:hypothetical protein